MQRVASVCTLYKEASQWFNPSPSRPFSFSLSLSHARAGTRTSAPIGGFPLALRMTTWPDARQSLRVWLPFSPPETVITVPCHAGLVGGGGDIMCSWKLGVQNRPVYCIAKDKSHYFVSKCPVCLLEVCFSKRCSAPPPWKKKRKKESPAPPSFIAGKFVRPSDSQNIFPCCSFPFVLFRLRPEFQ